MPPSLKIVRKRKQEPDDLSFMPPYAEQAKYIELANAFLSSHGAAPTEKNIKFIDEGRTGAGCESELDQVQIVRKHG
jgi:hypothetical protein